MSPIYDWTKLKEYAMTKRTGLISAFIFGLWVTCPIMADNQLPTPTASVQSLNAVAAVVNNEVITQTELDSAITEAKQQLAASANPQAINDSKLRNMVLQQLIDEKLQLEIAHRAKLSVTDAQVTQAIQHIAQANGLTLAQLKKNLEQHNVNYNDYRKMIHKQLLLHEVQQNAVGSEVTVSAGDAQKALARYQSQVKSQQQFHLIDIVSDTKSDAEKIMVQLKNGADIQTISPNHTKDLGWQTANTLPEIFLQQLSGMQSGDIAGPIQAANGFHVIKLVDVRGQAVQPNKTQLQNMAYQMKFQEAAEHWVAQLRKTAYIKITP